MNTASRFLLLCGALPCAMSWIAGGAPSSLSLRSTTSSAVSRSTPLFYGEKQAEALPLTSTDIEILNSFRSRHFNIPLLVLDQSVLPGQRHEYASADPEFKMMIEHILKHEGGAVGVVGRIPGTQTPLNMGVTFCLREDQVHTNQQGELVIIIYGERRFEVSGDNWDDIEVGDSSFHFCDVDLLDPTKEGLDAVEFDKTLYLSNQIPELVECWVACALMHDHASPAQLKLALRQAGPMPEKFDERASWAANLLNPHVPEWKLSDDIRPAMLCCENDYDRLALAFAAMNSSIEYMRGKKQEKQ